MVFDLLPLKPVEAKNVLRRPPLGAAFMHKSVCRLNHTQESKLSTKDLLALASMKNAAKREM